jgi:hypothetical protein
MRSPVLIYPYKRIPSEITQRIPDHWRVRRFRTEWMRAESLTMYWKCFQSTSWKIYCQVLCYTLRLWTHHPSNISTEWTVLGMKHDFDLCLFKRHKTPPNTEICSFQTTEIGFEKSSPRLT